MGPMQNTKMYEGRQPKASEGTPVHVCVRGVAGLDGAVSAPASSSACLAAMAAALLAGGSTTIENPPDCGEVRHMEAVLRSMGLGVRRTLGGAIEVETRNSLHPEPEYSLCAELDASMLLLGPLLAKWGEARIALPRTGGIDHLPLQQLIKGLRAMDAEVRVEHGYVVAKAKPLRGARIYLDVPRAEATTTLMTAAALAVGVTVIENAALDPEVVDVANMLGLMGADVRGAGSATIRVAGVRELRPVSYSVIPDRIEASLLLGAALSCGGRVRVTDVIPSHLEAVLSKFVEAGASVARGSDWVETGWDKLRPLSALKVRSTAYPGFPACLQPLFAALMCRARGVSVIADPGSDWPYPFADELRRMGACARVEGRSLLVDGPRDVTSAKVRATGFFTGAALMVFAIGTPGVTTVYAPDSLAASFKGFASRLSRLARGARAVVVCGARSSSRVRATTATGSNCVLMDNGRRCTDD